MLDLLRQHDLLHAADIHSVELRRAAGSETSDRLELDRIAVLQGEEILAFADQEDPDSQHHERGDHQQSDFDLTRHRRLPLGRPRNPLAACRWFGRHRPKCPRS